MSQPAPRTGSHHQKLGAWSRLSSETPEGASPTDPLQSECSGPWCYKKMQFCCPQPVCDTVFQELHKTHRAAHHHISPTNLSFPLVNINKPSRLLVKANHTSCHLDPTCHSGTSLLSLIIHVGIQSLVGHSQWHMLLFLSSQTKITKENKIFT